MSALRVGQILDGYCGGIFSLYNDEVRVEAIGVDWVVVRGLSTDSPQLFVGNPEELLDYTEKETP